MSDELQQQQRNLPPNVVITNNLVHEYTNKSTNTTITLITLSAKTLKHLKHIRLPCLDKQITIHIHKIRDTTTNIPFVQILTKNVPVSHQVNVGEISGAKHICKATMRGMVLALVFTTFKPKKRFVFDGIFYHGHGSNTFTPNVNSVNSKKFVSNAKNIIVSLKDLKGLKAKNKLRKRKRLKRRDGKNISLHRHYRSISSSNSSDSSANSSISSVTPLANMVSLPLNALYE